MCQSLQQMLRACLPKGMAARVAQGCAQSVRQYLSGAPAICSTHARSHRQQSNTRRLAYRAVRHRGSVADHRADASIRAYAPAIPQDAAPKRVRRWCRVVLWRYRVVFLGVACGAQWLGPRVLSSFAPVDRVTSEALAPATRCDQDRFHRAHVEILH